MLEVIQKRRSCRNFNDKPVELDKIKEIVNAGLLAPSGMNRQTPVVIAITDEKIRDKLAKINGRNMLRGDDFDPFYGAPVVLLVIAKKEGLSIHDGGACIENMLLEATNQGLNSCWIHRADDEIQCQEGRDLLSFTRLNFDEYVGVGHVILGYSDDPKYRDKVIADGRAFYK